MMLSFRRLECVASPRRSAGVLRQIRERAYLKRLYSCETVVRPTRLTREKALCRLKNRVPECNKKIYAMYNSVIGGIVTDPSLMNVPVDDQMVHRGHSVFDTCNVRAGKAFGLDFHLDRLLRSASLARIEAPFPKSQLKDIIVSTIAASEKRDDVLCRYWLSSGRSGTFSVSPNRLYHGSFYVICHHYTRSRDAVSLVTMRADRVAFKPKILANTKSTNYMLNALQKMYAEDHGAYDALQVTDDGFVRETSIACVAVVDEDGVLRAPEFDHILHGTTLQRVLDSMPQFIAAGVLKGAELAPLHIDQVRKAKEIILLGGGFCSPVTQLDGEPVGNGRPGTVFSALFDFVVADQENPEFTDDIPYDVYT